MRATAVARVDDQIDFALAIGDGDRQHGELEARVGLKVEAKPLDDAGLRLDCQNSCPRPAARGHKQRVEANVRTDVDKGEAAGLRQPPVERIGEFATLDHVEHLRREQRILFAAVAAGIETHARVPDRGVDGLLAEPVDRHAAQRHRGPQPEPVGRQPPGQRQHHSREPARRVAAIRGEIDRRRHRWKPGGDKATVAIPPAPSEIGVRCREPRVLANPGQFMTGERECRAGAPAAGREGQW